MVHSYGLGWLEVIYEEHDIIVLPRLEHRVGR
jgi:hypothetical protein